MYRKTISYHNYSITETLCLIHAAVRLVDGIGRCQGRVEHRPTASVVFAQSCDFDAGDKEAQVICREVGCDPNGARRVNPTKLVRPFLHTKRHL